MNAASLRDAQTAADSTSGTTAGTDSVVANNSDSSSGISVNVTGFGNMARQQTHQTNPLHDYDSYTYCLSLHLLSVNEFNNLINNPDQTYYPQHVLVSSAGRYNTTFVRDPAFKEDFYFDNLKMNTVVNVTSRSRSSNLIECSFTLIEPLGFTFINRLIEAAQRVNDAGNYLLMPYVLQIDFFGYKDGELVVDQQPVIGGQSAPKSLSGLTKIIPINLIELKSRVTTRGTEYNIRAVPYNHQAFNQVYVTSPAVFKVSAKTVQDVFGTGDANKSANVGTALNQRAELIAQRAAINATNPTTDNQIQNKIDQLNSLNSQIAALSTLQASGYADAMNRYWQTLQRSGDTAGVNEVYIQFHPTIASGQLYDSTAPINVAQAASGSSAKNTTQAAAGQSKEQIDFNAGTVSIPAGMTVDKLIDWAVRNSSYIRDQLRDPSNSTAAQAISIGKDNSELLKGPLNWYRIVPKVEIKSFDSKTNRYSLKVTYYVNPWTLSAKHPYAPYGKVPGFVKEYEWLFSGKNKDVLDMQIDFDMLYYTQIQAARNKMGITATAPERADPSLITEGDNNPNTVAAAGDNVIKPNGGLPFKRVSPVPINHVSNTYMQGVTGAAPSTSVTAGDLQRSFTINSKGDMIMLKIRIVGDPHFIKQDDIFYRADLDATSAPLTKNGSLWMDNGELYINVIFKTPGDYDETTGLAIPGNSPYSYSEFSGVYKLITVENEFSRGKFEQTLELAQISIEDTTGYAFTNLGQRSVALSLPQTLPRGFAATRFSGPSILQNSLQSGISAGASQVSGGQSGGVQGLVSGLLTQGGNAALNAGLGKLQTAAGKVAKDIFSDIQKGLGLGNSGGSTLGGNGGAGAPSESGTQTPQHTPEPSAMNQASENWNSDSTDAIPAENTDNVPLTDYAGVDGTVDVSTDVVVADLGVGDLIG